MALTNICYENTVAAEAACAKAHGWPEGPRSLSGIGTPEENVIGYWPNDQYLATDTGKVYAFNGTPGEATGWVILN